MNWQDKVYSLLIEADLPAGLRSAAKRGESLSIRKPTKPTKPSVKGGHQGWSYKTTTTKGGEEIRWKRLGDSGSWIKA